ncbi:hypothetical protein JOS77_12275 [Chromobacterium haemolyticum]|nr:hypothetical protein JOS77_12275 [Chromobacterium haemolyticum]
MLTLKPSLVALLAATSLASAVQAAPVWISIGDNAYQLLQQVSPKSRSQESRQLAVNALPAGVSAKGVATEKVHLVQVDDSVLPQLSDAIHHSLRHCGGFIVHKDLQDARTALKAPVAGTLLPSYQINDQATVNKLLPQLQDSNILGTIQSLSNYQNRFYTHQPRRQRIQLDRQSMAAVGRRPQRRDRGAVRPQRLAAKIGDPHHQGQGQCR